MTKGKKTFFKIGNIHCRIYIFRRGGNSEMKTIVEVEHCCTKECKDKFYLPSFSEIKLGNNVLPAGFKILTEIILDNFSLIFGKLLNSNNEDSLYAYEKSKSI